ncbi:MAG: hypothetical protein QOI20_1164, partial [Acidimicrobiaceae bacterium]|nr:hypothetical protein [Acidimicrobiaceae bacterium]
RGPAARPCHGRLWLPAPDEAAPDQAAFDRAAPDHAGLTQAVVDATPDTGTQAVVHPVVHRLVPAGPMSESALIPA